MNLRMRNIGFFYTDEEYWQEVKNILFDSSDVFEKNLNQFSIVKGDTAYHFINIHNGTFRGRLHEALVQPTIRKKYIKTIIAPMVIQCH